MFSKFFNSVKNYFNYYPVNENPSLAKITSEMCIKNHISLFLIENYLWGSCVLGLTLFGKYIRPDFDRSDIIRFSKIILIPECTFLIYHLCAIGFHKHNINTANKYLIERKNSFDGWCLFDKKINDTLCIYYVTNPSYRFEFKFDTKEKANNFYRKISNEPENVLYDLSLNNDAAEKYHKDYLDAYRI